MQDGYIDDEQEIAEREADERQSVTIRHDMLSTVFHRQRRIRLYTKGFMAEKRQFAKK